LSESSESRPGILERRYQRLLGWYPPRHRAAHGDEMLGVLLAAAPDGQRRPRLAEAANLLWGALLIWLRPRPAEQAASGWSDALAAFSVAAPLALLLQSVIALVTSGLGPGRGGLGSVPIGFTFTGLGLAVPFVLLGLRRTAGFICAAAALLLAYVAGHAVYGGLTGVAVGGSYFAVFLFSYATEAGALLGSPGPRRGWRVPGGPGWLVIMVAAAAAGVLQGGISRIRRLDAPFAVSLPHHQPDIAGWLAVAAAAGAVLAVLAVAVARRSALARRLVTLFAIAACPWLVSRVWHGPVNPVASTLLSYLPPLILAGVVVTMAMRERRSSSDVGRPARA
jgi:hypothetical protein